MDKTKVDDMLIEMIRPKLDEIERRFSEGKPLTQDDINTLLLKSQYNHINHLDRRLDEISESVSNLEHKFDLAVQQMNARLDATVQELNAKSDATIQKLNAKSDATVRELNAKFDATVQELNAKFESTVRDMRADYRDLEQRFEILEQKIEGTIQKALNRNMMGIVLVLGLFLTLSKIIDKF